MIARLTLPKSKDAIILTNKGGASGIHDANDRYAYDEWHGNVSFKDSSKKGKGKSAQGVACHEVRSDPHSWWLWGSLFLTTLSVVQSCSI
jgi:hypothetical protein